MENSILYYTNLLDSTFFQSTYAGHSYVKLNFDKSSMSEKFKETYGKYINSFYQYSRNPDNNTSDKKEGEECSDSVKSERTNDKVAEFVIQHLIPYLIKKKNADSDTEKDIKIVASLNQIADNAAIIADLGEPSDVNTVEIITKLFDEEKMILSTYENKFMGELHTILSYIYISLMSALYRIVESQEKGETVAESEEEKEKIEFISSLFSNLGGVSFKNRTRDQKVKLLKGDICTTKELIDIFNETDSEEKYIRKLNEKFDVLQKNTPYRLGYITTVKAYILGKNKDITDEMKKNSLEYLSTDKNKDENKDENKLTFFDIIDSLKTLHDATEKTRILNEKYIFEYEYNKAPIEINQNDNIFTKGLKALINNKNLFNNRLNQFIGVADTFESQGVDKNKLKNDIREFVYVYLSNMVKNIKGGRSAFIKEIIKIKNSRGQNTSEETKFLTELKEYGEIGKCLNLEEKKKGILGPKKALNITIKIAILNIIIEMINVSYNCTYSLLTSRDKRMFEAEGILKFYHGKFIFSIKSIYDREYNIENGKLIVKREETIL